MKAKQILNNTYYYPTIKRYNKPNKISCEEDILTLTNLSKT